ncbi:multicopper oxidase domain-containing protein [Kitasatospora sp. LaBMicrA B282]|uniref:multicopper oxidase domain-containing protein n=1 Tax=Kitasatospora sp. LaBMicrA B282 TaxID=3420949 RepID=UPI003D122091
MPRPTPPSPAPASARRTLLRQLLGGGAVAALTGAATLADPTAAQARPATRAGDDPCDAFAADEFQPTGKVREYWIQADSFQHNAVPTGHDPMMGRHFTPEQTSFPAIGFRAYTPQWGRPLDADPGPDGIGANSGIPGPVLRAEVGDVVKVHFRNNDQHYGWPHSVHPHGVRYDGASDGGWLAATPDRPGTAVPVGASYTYTWTCPPGSVGTWLYHDHSALQSPAAAAPAHDPNTPDTADHPDTAGHPDIADHPDQGARAAAAKPGGGDDPMTELGAELGLFGVLVVTDEQTPKVDREFVVFLHDASKSDIPSLAQSLDLVSGGAFLDNTPTFTAKVGDRVRWRVASLGTDFHVFHVHGHRWRSRQGYQGWVDCEIIGPATTLTIEYLEDNPGDWVYHCHVTHHMMGGMAGRYLVTG